MLSALLIGWVDFAMVMLVAWLSVAWVMELRYRYRSGDHRPLRIVIAEWLGLLDKPRWVRYKGGVTKAKENR